MTSMLFQGYRSRPCLNTTTTQKHLHWEPDGVSLRRWRQGIIRSWEPRWATGRTCTKTKEENKKLQKYQDNKFFLKGTFTGTPALETAAAELWQLNTPWTLHQIRKTTPNSQTEDKSYNNKASQVLGLYRLDLAFGNGFLKYNTKRTSNKRGRKQEPSLKSDSTGLGLQHLMGLNIR